MESSKTSIRILKSSISSNSCSLYL